MPRRLKWKKVGEVSVVDAGANLKGRFPITKRKGQMADLKELFEAALETPVEGEQDIEKNAEGDDEKAAMVALYRFADACGLRKIFDQPEPVEKAEEVDIEDEGDDMSDDLENASVELQKRFELIQKQLDDEKAAREAVEEQLQKAKDQREYDLWLTKAKENLQFVPGETYEDMAQGLHEIAKMNPELADAQYERMCKVSELLKKSKALDAIGTSGRNELSDDQFVSKRAKELEGEGLSPAQALRKAAVEAEKKQR